MKKTILEFETKWSLDDLGTHLLERAPQLVAYLTEKVMAPIWTVAELMKSEAEQRDRKVKSFLSSLESATAMQTLEFSPHDGESHVRVHQWNEWGVGAEIPRESYERGDRHEALGLLRVVNQAVIEESEAPTTPKPPVISEAVRNEEVLKIQRTSDERILQLIQEKEKLTREIPDSDTGKDLIEVLRAVELFKKHKSSYPHRGLFLCSDRLIALLNEEANKRGEQIEVRLVKNR